MLGETHKKLPWCSPEPIHIDYYYSFMFTPTRTAPLTWLDVERRFKHATGNFTHFRVGISNIQCFTDGVEIEHDDAKQEDIQKWLREIFGRALADDASSINLDIGKQAYPISYIPTSAQAAQPSRNYPLWRDRAYAGAADPTEELPVAWEDGPGIVAFHSFKGGVGRTTSLMTYAAAQLNAADETPIRILLIDADLEAPGISFWLAEENRPTVSFINLLEALHYPPLDVDTSLNYFAAELRKTSLNVGSAKREIFILPAALQMTEIMDMPVKPEHMVRNPGNPWILTDHLRGLGKKLAVDMIFVDLRAGLSELSSPLLFDPRIEHFFVTTVAPQSVTGMAEILAQLYRFQNTLPDTQKSVAKPSVIISLLTKQLKQLRVFAQASEKLNNAWPSASDDVLSSGFELLEAEFSESLMSIGSVKEALTLLPGSALYKTAQLWAKARIATLVTPQAGTTPSINNTQSEAENLYATCERFQFAENATDDSLLVTDPLRNLAKHYLDELPNVVSVGAKGTGKTFTYIQICRTRNWHNFLAKLGQVSNQALELPNLLDELRNRRIGLVCFVRVDYVQAVIRQNLAQYLSRFQPFKLEWTAESFLRLAYWICGKAGVINAKPEQAESLTTDQLIAELERLWGKKLGSDRSNEANSARWVFAALCDLNGRLQARDLVRFLKFAAQQMMKTNAPSSPDRLLFPDAIRKALPNCSQEKITEAVSEIKVLKQWQDLLESIKPEDRKVPFSATAVKLTPDLLTALKELGVIYEDIDRQQEENRFYLPEIYRSGLRFQSVAVGRPRVQALLKRNLGTMPF